MTQPSTPPINPNAMDPHSDNLFGARRRLAQHAISNGVEAPVSLLDDNCAPTDELLCYCRQHALTLDWVYCGAGKERRTPATENIKTLG